MQRPLAELLAGLRGQAFGDWEGVEVTGVAIDSRQVGPGNLFVALDGQRTRGLFYVHDALARGAAAVVVPADALPPATCPGLRTPDTRRALAVAAARFYGEPARHLRIFGVTGTNGKSTVVHMLAQILAAAGRPAGIWSTPVVDTGRRAFRPALTTPEPHQLHRFLRETLDSGRRDACIEVSSHAVALGRLAEVPFTAAAVTNLTVDHLDFHGSFAAYAEVKRAFVHGLPAGTACLLNADDERVRPFGDGARAWILSYGCSAGAELRAEDLQPLPGGTRFRVVAHPRLLARLPGEGLPASPELRDGGSPRDGRPGFWLELPVPGRHNVLNALAAAGMALATGISVEAVRRGLSGFRPPARRLARTEVAGCTILDDVAMNEASYDAVFETVCSLEYPQVVVVNAIRGNRGAAVNARIAEVLARWNRRLAFAPLIVSLSRSHVARYEADYRVRPEELAAFVEAARAGGLALSVHEELPGAIAEGVDRLAPGAALLLLGTFGMDDGAELACRLLQQRLASSRGQV